MDRVGRRSGWTTGALALASGYMLAPQAGSGVPTIQICTAQGMVSVADPAAAKDTAPGKPAPSKAANEHPCPYAATAFAMVAPGAYATPAFLAVDRAGHTAHAASDQRPGLGLAAPPPHPTGPPCLV
jgi:hypothetical protein